jgi:16S rRNA (guanine527-N7)-methyltransferase
MSGDNNLIVNIANQPVPVPSADAIQGWIAPYGIQLTGDQIRHVQSYIAMLVFWNQRISLTSIKDPEEIVARHFGESFFFARFIPPGASRLADVGSGAGFPGLALKIIRPYIQVFLIEQDTRKSTFLHEVIRLLDIKSATVCRTPFEGLATEIGNFDLIVSRAVGGHKNLLKWARTRLNDSGHVALWLGSEDAIRVTQLKGWNWSPLQPLPDSKRRVLAMGDAVK